MCGSFLTGHENKSKISVAFALALASPLFGGPTDPVEQSLSHKGASAAPVVNRQQLQGDTVAGGPGSAIIRLTPVATHPGGGYNTGGLYSNANITGQRLRLGLGASGRTYWNVQVSDWAPDLLASWQAAISNNSLLGTTSDCGGGPGSCPGAGNLAYASQPCSTSANCTSAFGEPGINGHSGSGESICVSGFCHNLFVNHTRGDWTHASVADPWGGFGIVGDEARVVWSVAPSNDPVTDTGLTYYGGTVVIDVPTNARGLYRISLNPANTYLFDSSSPPGPIPIAALIPGELEVACICNANVNNDGSINVIDEAVVLNCINGNCGGCVNSCDVNCDGAIDWEDIGIVRCQLQGFTNCCGAPTGACLGMNVGTDYESCQVTTTMSCSWFAGTYQGNDTTCTGCLCNADVNNNGKVQFTDVACVRDCAQFGLCGCCASGCDVDCDGSVDFTDMAATWCEFEGGSNCCNVAVGACTIPTGGWPDCIETSQSACQFFGGTYYGNGSLCADFCPATRIFEDADYCPGRADLVRLELGDLTGVSAIAVEDSPPADWTVSAISNGGSYDAVNHKVKWGPLFSPFPAELSYEVTPDESSATEKCFSGIVSADGVNKTTCGDDCMNYECCPYNVAETPQPICDTCSVGYCGECATGSCLDGSVSLCEVIAYGCAWVRGCNDDIAGVTRAAFIWRNGECYCWDEIALNFVPTTCGLGNTCCPGGGGVAAGTPDVPAALDAESAGVARAIRQGGLRKWSVSIEVAPTVGTSAVAAELIVPTGWKVISVGEDGAVDGVNGKIKWGPYFDNATRTLTATIGLAMERGTTKAVRELDKTSPSLRGTVSFDGVNLPIKFER